MLSAKTVVKKTEGHLAEEFGGGYHFAEISRALVLGGGTDGGVNVSGNLEATGPKES